MTYATGSTSGFSYVPELTFGTTPATPQMINIPMVSSTLDYTKDIINDPTIISDRMERDEKHGNKHVAGNIVTTAQHGQFDDWLEAALGGTWTTDVLKVASATGGTERSFTVEQKFGNVGQYRQFTGVRINTWEITGAQNAYAQQTFGLIGKGMTVAQAPLDISPTEVIANKPGLTFLNGTLTLGGVAVTCTAFSLNHNNNMTGLFGVNSSSAVGINWAEAVTTGSMTFYFEDVVQYNRFLNETTAAGVISMTDGTNTITINIPKMKFNTASLAVPGPGVLFMTMNWKALYDSTLGSTFSLTRS